MMTSEPFRSLTSRVVPLLRDDVDTDQIVPARFLKGTSREGLGGALFADWRYDAAGAPVPEFALNRPEAQGAQVLLAGRNFGCGSSREHAVWALAGFGFRAVVAPSFADIFRANALQNGLLPVALDAAACARIASGEGMEVHIDLVGREARLPDGSGWAFEVDPFARHRLLEGQDALGFLLARVEQIAEFESRRVVP
jgi:3-isopropylmalate/(R)-2-methylmalate dehydratase small subunit